MKRRIWVVSIALLLVLSLSIAGCSGGKQDATQQQKMPQIATVASIQQPIADWDPAIAYGYEQLLFLNTYETLLRNQPETNTFKPVLATSYSKSADGLEWTFKLRQGVKFHDGADFNADAVKFSIERNKNYKKGAAYIWDPVKEIKVVDDYTIQIILSQPAALDAIVSSPNDAYIYSPKAVGTDYQKGTDWFSQGKEAGTGPYMLQSTVQGNEVVLTKFNEYWGGWEGKHFDKVMFKMVSENASRRQMIEGGEADATHLMAEDAKTLQANSKVQVIISDDYKNLLCMLNTQKAPLNNKLVRQAFAYSFPYQQVIDYVQLGQFGSVAKDTVLPANLWGATDKIPYTYDLNKAKSLLAEAGYPNGGLKVNVTYNAGNEDIKKTLELWKSELVKIGVTLDIKAMSYDSKISMARSPNPNDRQDMEISAYWVDVVSPMSYYSQLVKSGASFNFSYFSNKEIDKELDAADSMSAIDHNKSAEMFKAVGQKIADESIIMNLGDAKGVIVLNKSFKGFKPNPAYQDVIFFYDTYREQ